jgi:putative membrane protein
MWSSLGAVSTSLARVIWLHVEERDGQLGKADLIDKINALNMVRTNHFLAMSWNDC